MVGSLGDDFPLSDDPDATRFTIVRGDEIAGLIQYGEELEPDCRYGVMEAAWRDFPTGRWRDALLTELVVRPRERGAGEVTPTTTGSEAREEQ